MTIIVQTTSAAAKRNYTWLQEKVTRWTRRADLAVDIPDFIMLAEARISGDLEARLSNTATTLSTLAGLQTVQLPSDLNSLRSLSIPTHGKVTYMPPDELASTYANQSPGVPQHYTVIGEQIRFGPIPDASYAVDCVYHADIPALADDPSGLNWLITGHPEIYLAATLCEAFTAIRDTANLQVWEGKYRLAVEALNRTDWNSGGMLSVRSDAITP